jgi:hypothetical protein
MEGSRTIGGTEHEVFTPHAKAAEEVHPPDMLVLAGLGVGSAVKVHCSCCIHSVVLALA